MEITKEQKLYAEVVQKAWEDEAFKKELIANPVEAIENLTGHKLNIPEGKTLVVRDQTEENTIYINIPANQEVNAELSEEELENAAGGVYDPGDGSGCIKNPILISTPTLPTDIFKI